jgi:hypothetical protein
MTFVFPALAPRPSILSWFTPYTKAWSLVSAVELIITIVLGCKVVQIIKKSKLSDSLFNGVAVIPVHKHDGL